VTKKAGREPEPPITADKVVSILRQVARRKPLTFTKSALVQFTTQLNAYASIGATSYETSRENEAAREAMGVLRRHTTRQIDRIEKSFAPHVPVGIKSYDDHIKFQSALNRYEPFVQHLKGPLWEWSAHQIWKLTSEVLVKTRTAKKSYYRNSVAVQFTVEAMKHLGYPTITSVALEKSLKRNPPE